MRFAVCVASLALAMGASVVTAPVAASAATAHTKSCSARATEDGLKGAARKDFLRKCQKGALAPSKPSGPAPDNLAAQVITAPSGADKTTRSKQCDTEADRRGLKDSKRDGFRLSCLASAAPVTAIGIREQQPVPTTAGKAGLDGLTATPPQGAGAATSAGAQMKPK